MNFLNNITNNILLLLLLILFNGSPADGSHGSLDTINRPEIQEVILNSDSVIFSINQNIKATFQGEIFFSKEFAIHDKFRSLEIYINNSSGLAGFYYQYFLEGYDKDWGRLQNLPVKEYINLPAGKYTFHVRQNNREDQPTTESAFKFRIVPPVYKTKLAYLIYLIAGILLLRMISKIVSYRFARERFRLERIINNRTNELVKEMDKSESLLENILPKGTADELKVKGKVSKKKYELATVLFSDIQGFTKLAEQMNPETLIDQLDHFFLYFDSVVEKYNIEKIKTIGDAYMCAGGIPEKNRTNPVEVVMAALEMSYYMKKMHDKANKTHAQIWDIRIGIHTGPVIAGVVGHKKLSYDIWGDTVNIASRMESSGEAGKINISESSYDLVKDFFDCQHRGKMPVKYKGEIDMYFVENLKPEFVGKDEGMPNEKFFTRVQFLKLMDVEDSIEKKYKEDTNQNFYFHNIDFTNKIKKRIDDIGKNENISNEDLLLLKTAALFYNLGFILNYNEPEKSACDYAKQVLTGFGYSVKQTTLICNLILSAHYPFSPKNLPEEVFCDAVLEYLGNNDYKEISMKLYQEFKEHNKINSLAEWKVHQTTLIGEHEFYTPTARNARHVDKNEQLKKVIQLMENS